MSLIRLSLRMLLFVAVVIAHIPYGLAVGWWWLRDTWHETA